MDFIKAYKVNNGVGPLFSSQNMDTNGDEMVIHHLGGFFKIDRESNILWAVRTDDYQVADFKLLDNGEVIILGSLISQDYKLRILKISKNGEIIWHRFFDVQTSFFIDRNNIGVNNNGDYYFSIPLRGITNNSMLIKTDSNGTILKSVTIEPGYFQIHYDPFENEIVLFETRLNTPPPQNPPVPLYGALHIQVLDNDLNIIKKRRLKVPGTYILDRSFGITFTNITANHYQLVVASSHNLSDYHFYANLSKDLEVGNATMQIFPESQSFGLYFFVDQYVYKYRYNDINERLNFNQNSRESLTFTTSEGLPFVFKEIANGHFFRGDDLNDGRTKYTVSKDFNKCVTLTSSTSSLLGLQTINVDMENANVAVQDYVVQELALSIGISKVAWEETPICAPIRNLQSPHMYFQASGSNGVDGSTPGIHLRWMFKNQLENHLPKGDLATTTHHLNKPNDFVKIYRAPYDPQYITLDLSTSPQMVDDFNKIWVYQFNFQLVHVHFRNASKYDTVRATIDPQSNPFGFIQSYGAELIEIETQDNLFFSVRLVTNSIQASSQLQVEYLGIEENNLIASKNVIARQVFNQTSLSSAYLEGENGRSVRYKATDCIVEQLVIEFYDETIRGINKNYAWQELGQFSLTTNDAEAFQRLEPSPDLIDGQWPRYNDQTFVNVAAYQDKWNGTRTAPDRNIKEVVQQYLTLSDQANNPTGVEAVQFTTDESEADSLEISNLDMLQLASFDYHIARMLGLGYLDTDPTVMSGKFIYKAEYTTTADLGDGEGAREIKHTYLSLPTSINDERLPYAVDLETPEMGIKYSGSAESQVQLTDDEGYTQDGKTRFITLFAKVLPEYNEAGFFATNDTFNFASSTFPVFAGIEYKAQTDTDWQRPEILNNVNYLAAVPNGVTPYAESVVLHLPDPGEALYVHREKNNGTHIYGSYGVNWFGRATRSTVEHSVTTAFPVKNPLLPPTGLQALLIQPEKPLLLTSQNDQTRLANHPLADKTLVRLNFEYNSFQELLSYKITPEDMGAATDPLDPNAIFPDADEVFADEVEIFFRSDPPTNMVGKAKNIANDPVDPLVSIIRTENYSIVSTGDEWIPTVAADKIANFAGGVLTLENEQYLIKEMLPADNAPAEGPIIKVYKQTITDGVSFATLPKANDDLQVPSIKADGKLMAVENMQNAASWGSTNPHTFKVQIGNNWAIHREQITQPGASSDAENFVEKSRGIWGTANVETTTDAGVYKITFDSVQLGNHPQFQANGNSVNWYRGIVRVHLASDITGKRKNLQVIKIEHLGQGGNLVLYIVDPDRQQAGATTDLIQTGIGISVNFYPGYQVHLYADNIWGLNATNVLPTAGEGIRYTIFGTRSVSNTLYSNLSTPQLMFAQEIIEPQQPELPQGGLYATRPDSFGKANYTLTTQFSHAPFALLYLRADEQTILNALYTSNTITTIKAAIAALSDASYETNRWQNLLAFDYTYPVNDTINENGKFGVYPPDAGGYRLPNPDRPELFLAGETPGTLDPGSIKERIQATVTNAFVPLTEVPLLYQYINNGSYQPIPKKQVIRGRDGQLLKTEDLDFDIAPMAKKVGTNQVLFTDFGLDGTSDNLYFYAVREMGSTMQLGPFSPILGPISLVNTKAPEAPQVKSMMPVLANPVFGSGPSMQFEINAYNQLQHIKQVNVYRTLVPNDSLSVRSMDLVKTIELTNDQQSQDNVWVIEDDFADVEHIPYGEPLYYRLTVDREVTYADKDGHLITDYAASAPSKLLISNIVESTSPASPMLTYSASPLNAQFEIANVRLTWQKTTHNGKYHLYKMNTQGNWIKIYELISNDATITVDLATTDLQSNELLLKNTEGIGIYHHFKVEAENSAGMFSTQENVLTIPEEAIPAVVLKNQQLAITQTTIGNNFDTTLINNLDLNEHVVLQVNGLYRILDKNSLSAEAYFSKDGGVTATDDFQGATLFWNTNIAGFALTPEDEITFFNVYPVDYTQPFPENGDLLHQQLQITTTTIGNQFDTGQVCNLAITTQLILEVNGRRMLVNKDSLNQAAYFSQDGGVTATDDFQGATLYWNTNIAGFALGPTDDIWIFNLYPVDQTLLS